jgi:hypothetical protein
VAQRSGVWQRGQKAGGGVRLRTIGILGRMGRLRPNGLVIGELVTKKKIRKRKRKTAGCQGLMG